MILTESSCSNAVREVLDSLYSNIDQETEEAPAEAGQTGEGSLPAKLTFVSMVKTVIRMIKTISLGNKVTLQKYKPCPSILFVVQEKDILELISEGMRKEEESQELEETNKKSDEPTAEEIDADKECQKELQDNLVTSPESLVDSNSVEVIQSTSGK